MRVSKLTSRARALRALRTLRGMTRVDLARRADLPLSALRRLEQGEGELTGWRRERLLLALDATAADLAALERLARRGAGAATADDANDERFAIEAGVALARALCRRLRPTGSAADRLERLERRLHAEERAHGG